MIYKRRVNVIVQKVVDTALADALASEVNALHVRLSEAEKHGLTLLEQITLLQHQLAAAQQDVTDLHYACSNMVAEGRKNQRQFQNLVKAAQPFADRAGSIPPEADAAVAFVHPASDYARIAEAVKKTE